MGIETLPVGIETTDGQRLDGDLRAVADAHAAAVLCHPHPLYGGDRYNGVVDTLFDVLPGAGVTTLRFDFRGVGRSTGTHGNGIDERFDVEAAVDLVTERTGLPVHLVGYSFGAVVALSVDHPAVASWIAIAPPLAALPGERAAAYDPRPKQLLVPGHDQFGDPEVVAAAVADWTATTMEVLVSADHFLAGHLATVARRVAEIIG